MKKNYEKPMVEVIELRIESQLLENSHTESLGKATEYTDEEEVEWE